MVVVVVVVVVLCICFAVFLLLDLVLLLCLGLLLMLALWLLPVLAVGQFARCSSQPEVAVDMAGEEAAHTGISISCRRRKPYDH